MKKYQAMIAAVMAGMMLTAQPAFAAAGNGITQSAWVNENLGPGEAQWVVEPGAAPGQDTSQQTPSPGQDTSQQMPSQGQTVTPSLPAENQHNSNPSAPPTAGSGDNQAPPGDAGSTLSPVITAGGGQQTDAAADAAAKQAADEAAKQAADAAAKQAADEAAKQAADAAAKQAADAAAKEAADAAAKQQSSGRHIDPSKPMVALTFDDGPQPSVGNRIMDCLAKYGGKATFFMVGERVAARKTEVQRMVAEGHEVANHTMNHKYLQKLGAAEIQSQVTKANDAIEAACGVRPKLLRLPGGNHNATVVANTHMPMIQWNIDTLDWKTKNAQKTVQAVLGHVKDGDIVLMHELYSQSGDAALQIIPELVNRGYQLVTVSEMAAAKGKTLQAGKLYSSFK